MWSFSFVVDNVLQVNAQRLVQVVEEFLVEDEGNTWEEKIQKIFGGDKNFYKLFFYKTKQNCLSI